MGDVGVAPAGRIRQALADTAERSPARRERSRFQPLLLVVAAASALPAIVAAGLGGWWVAFVLVCGALGTVAAVIEVRRPLRGRMRAAAGAGLTGLAAVGLVGLLVAGVGNPPGSLLLLACAVVVTFASTRVPRVRWSQQVAVLAVVLLAGWRADLALADLALMAVLVGGVAWSAGLFTQELVRARRDEREARRSAERRAELLEAVRRLPGGDVHGAARGVTETLRELAFDGGGVFEVRLGDRLVTVHLDRMTDMGRPVPHGEGLAWKAIEEGRTVVSADYQAEARRLEGRPDIRSMVAAPVQVEGRPVAVVMGIRHVPHDPTPGEVEIVEVLAAHLGGVMEAARRTQRQAELLARMRRLESMRSGLLSAVSSDVRVPLLAIGRHGRELRGHHRRLPAAERVRLLTTLCDQAEDLRSVLDTVLDVSGVHARREEAELTTIDVDELVEPLVRTGVVTLATGGMSPGLSVRVEPDLVREGLRLLVTARRDGDEPGDRSPLPLNVRVEGGEVELVPEHPGRVASPLIVSLASQLLVAGGASLRGGARPVVLLRHPSEPGEDARGVGDSAGSAPATPNRADRDGRP